MAEKRRDEDPEGKPKAIKRFGSHQALERGIRLGVPEKDIAVEAALDRLVPGLVDGYFGPPRSERRSTPRGRARRRAWNP